MTWGCSSSTPSTASAPPDAGANGDAYVDAAAKDCPKTTSSAMVRVDDGFCIDATEVTNAQYAAFVDAKAADTSGQEAFCAWNGSFAPTKGWPATSPSHPVVNVDWCDAAAYCQWAGKRLCGKIGGGATPYAEFADPKKSEWLAACSHDGTKKFPYGATYDGKACNGKDYGAGAPMDVGTAKTCEGGFPGVYDMSGNVTEWEDSCDGTTGDGDSCRFRGGTFGFVATYLDCAGEANPGKSARKSTSDDLGFRCCAD